MTTADPLFSGITQYIDKTRFVRYGSDFKRTSLILPRLEEIIRVGAFMENRTHPLWEDGGDETSIEKQKTGEVTSRLRPQR